ncbi:MAG: hypothetical protein ACYDBJ_00045 [Aggregatilineales bacterium]
MTIGLLAALKCGRFRVFYRWLKRDYDGLFGGLPDRTRLQRALNVHQDWCPRLLAEPSLFTAIDSYPIELISRSARDAVPGKSVTSRKTKTAGRLVSDCAGSSTTGGKWSVGRRHRSTLPTRTFIR